MHLFVLQGDCVTVLEVKLPLFWSRGEQQVKNNPYIVYLNG